MALRQLVEELEGSVEAAHAAEQLLDQLEALKQSRITFEANGWQDVHVGESDEQRFVGQSGMGREVANATSSDPGQVEAELQLIDLRAKIAELEVAQIEHMVEKKRLIAENNVAVKSRERAQVIMARIVDLKN